jgi:hypothetical protein
MNFAAVREFYAMRTTAAEFFRMFSFSVRPIFFLDIELLRPYR